ncbi:MAG: glutamine synthetase beta-grasp domain-containing protein, partial [Acidimicrobiales bacterium]
MVESEGCEFVDFRFIDLPGVMQHVTIPASVLDEGQFTDGHGFDGSSVRGFQEIQESDMVLIADPDTAYVDPFMKRKTAVIHCYVADPVTGESYSRDPRYVATKAEAYMRSTGLADTAYFGPEPEFFIFDDVRFDTTGNSSYYYVNSVEGIWNTGTDEGPNLGYKPRTKQGYFPVPPMDHFQDMRSDMAAARHGVGIETELHHHEVASGGQGEIGMKFNTLLRMADQLMTFKYILKGVAWQAGKSLTFMPKPIFEDNGSGMHTHQSLWKGGEPLFFDEAG